jgi:drug/metabolite transporter (DMT)-like permease
MTKVFLGYCQLAIAQIGVGISIVLAKQLMHRGIPAVMQMEARFAGCFLILLLMLLLRRQGYQGLSKFKAIAMPRDWILLVAQALCAGVLFNVFMLLGLEYTTATSAGIIASILPAIVAILSLIILKEKLARRNIIAIVLAIIGVSILHLDNISTEQGNFALLGGALVFLALIPEALYTIFAKLLGDKIEPLSQATIINFISMLVFLPFYLFIIGIQQLIILDPIDITMLGISCFCSMLFYYYWTKGIMVIPAMTAAVFTGLMPISTTIFAILMLGETFTIYDSIGMLCVLVSIVVGSGTNRAIVSKKVYVS